MKGKDAIRDVAHQIDYLITDILHEQRRLTDIGVSIAFAESYQRRRAGAGTNSAIWRSIMLANDEQRPQ